ncbi:hypothetical protein GDO81_026095 [Engystomops pustulosus]|uniref:Uncharacterized protein n=1 Tax=Engystomops pustulosus TaxID=76066 RepID=A0AAV6YS36_ENGPU|nr:hypothetical protein GDO81_026095 [Engystomops pustulosus]
MTLGPPGTGTPVDQTFSSELTAETSGQSPGSICAAAFAIPSATYLPLACGVTKLCVLLLLLSPPLVEVRDHP